MLRHFVVFQDVGGQANYGIAAMCSLGWIGVDAFFVLSGFLITNILLKARCTDGFFRCFYTRRLFRIAPLYYLFLIIFLIGVPLIARSLSLGCGDSLLQRLTTIPAVEWVYWCYLSNVPIGLQGFRYPILDISWSLAIEEQFYLLWPIGVRYLSATALRRACIALFLFSLLARAAVYWWGLPWTAAYCWTPCRFDGFAAGAFVALTGDSGVAAARVLPAYRLAVFTGAVGFLVALLAPVLTQCTEETALVKDVLPNPAVFVFGFSALAIFFAGIVGCIVSGDKRFTGGLMGDAGGLARLGRYSFCIYLIHIPVGGAVEAAVQWIGRSAGHPHFSVQTSSVLWVAVLISVGASYLMASVSWRLWERPWLRLRDHFCPVAG